MFKFSGIYRFATLVLAIWACHGASAAEFMTQHCKDYGQPEIRFEVSDKTPSTDAQWLIATLEQMAREGSVFRAGETIQIGWMIQRFEAARRKTLRLLEPNIGFLERTYTPSMSNTLLYMRQQKDTVESLEGEWHMAIPSMEQTAIVHEGHSNFRTLSFVRDEPRDADSGWRLLKTGDTLAALDNGHYRRISLYDLALQRPHLIHLFALPPGIAVERGMDLQESFFVDGKPLAIRMDSYMARKNARYALEDAAIEARFAPRTSRGLYQERLQQHAVSFWKDAPPMDAQEWCVVKVWLSPQGSVLKQEFFDCAENEALRKSVQLAVSAASPFPLPANPEDFSESEPLVFKESDRR